MTTDKLQKTILTYKVRHNHPDIHNLLKTAKAVAEYGIAHKCTSTAQVKQFGLKSAISNAILRKYSAFRKGKNKIKKVSNIVIPIPYTSIKWDDKDVTIVTISTKDYTFKVPFDKKYYPNVKRIHYAELNAEYIYLACEIDTSTSTYTPYIPDSYLGVDRNATGHICVAANPDTGKILKLGKEAPHISKKYQSLRRKALKRGHSSGKNHPNRKARIYTHKQSNKIRDINHKISRKLVDEAKRTKSAIVLEDLHFSKSKKQKKYINSHGTLVASKTSKTQRRILNSWPFYQLQTFIVYKAHLQNVPVIFVNPQYTSQRCSRCAELGERPTTKEFKCPHCGHADHADVNAAFNIAARGRSLLERDNNEGSTDAPKGAMISYSDINISNL